MLDFLTQGLEVLVNPFYSLGITLWNLMMGVIGLTAQQTPETFSGAAWGYVVQDLYPVTAAIGATLLNLSFYIGYIRQSSNLKQSLTLELMVELGIKAVVANALLLMGTSLMQHFFSLSGLLAGVVYQEIPTLAPHGMTDVGSALFFMFFGVIFFAVCLVCAGTIFLAVYGRYLQLYLLIGMAPLAFGTLPAGGGMAQSAYAFIRTFFAKTFEIVVIMLAVVIANKLCASVSFGNLEGVTGLFEGMVQALQQMFTMVLLTASVKGADAFLRRAFAL